MDVLREIELCRYLIEQIETIETYTKGFRKETFLRDGLVKDATLMKLIVLGEYSVRINEDLKARFSEIEWQLIKAARNFYAHVYRGVDWNQVWEVLEVELPLLKNRLENIVQSLEQEQNGETN